MKMQRLLLNVAMAPIDMQVVRKGHYPKPKMQEKVLGIEFFMHPRRPLFSTMCS
jgi:hypothetical protein